MPHACAMPSTTPLPCTSAGTAAMTINSTHVETLAHWIERRAERAFIRGQAPVLAGLAEQMDTLSDLAGMAGDTARFRELSNRAELIREKSKQVLPPTRRVAPLLLIRGG